ncbi:hypothetical protein [Halostreptopolyspora alba]|uniref:hypothetical protein n=1 Tax=Halostreptopolyspora alba TaxID=2487137 RepID=UPI0011CE4F5D
MAPWTAGALGGEDTVSRVVRRCHVGQPDGQPSGGKGGTGDAVEVARGRGVPVDVIWPEGVRRE